MAGDFGLDLYLLIESDFADRGLFNGVDDDVREEIKAETISLISSQFAARLSTIEAETREKWRTDVENAPRDGTRILLCWDNSPTLSPHVELGKRKAFSWVNTYGHPFSGEPTHWMPLPMPARSLAAAKGEG